MSILNIPAQKELLIRLEYTIEFMLKHYEQLPAYIPIWKQMEYSGFEHKVSSEFALLLMLAARVPSPGNTLPLLIQTAGEKIAARMRTAAHLDEIRKSPQKAATMAQCHIYLSLAGLPDAEWDHCIRLLLKKGYGDVSDRAFYRLFDKNWFRSLLNEPAGDASALLPLSLLNSRFHPAYMEINDAYAFTHILMYMSDFGLKDISPGMQQIPLKELVQSAIMFELSEENHDLLSEFLMNYVFISDEWDAISLLGWKYLTHTWDSMSFLPGPSLEPEVFERLEGEVRSAYAFKEIYHTNLVAAALCAVLLYRPLQACGSVNLPCNNPRRPDFDGFLHTAATHYAIPPAYDTLPATDTEQLWQLLQQQIGRNPPPAWLSFLQQGVSNTQELGYTLALTACTLGIRNENIALLYQGMLLLASSEQGITHTLSEAFEFFLNRQDARGRLPEYIEQSGLLPRILQLAQYCRLAYGIQQPQMQE